MSIPTLNPTVALVAIDLQNGIVSLPVVPQSGSEVVAKTAELANAFRARKLPVIFVHTSYQPDGAVALKVKTDVPPSPPNLDPEWSAFAPALGVQPIDVVVTKHQWGAFTGTDLDVQLRRRGITDIVLTGIATNIGVESTAREAYENNYNVVIVSDAVSTWSTDAQTFALTQIFPKLGQVATAADVEAALETQQQR
ncbi:hydrolase [Burkholderia pseudomallei]|uniref:hydrolase n=1 Tax=Burkholderia pseudomallei TaxID=28450 RepID=UPI000A1A00C0|nr:hydrolase [Burkholderia pseudomallei]ARK58260.1 hydrolase [Burkholderia pseudomallei]ARL06277.1 hydrolase [Burkholderia pseudomallei]ARL39358.1 hydrolase [Burkholderia pseudomallei]ARL89349.1 hydrolase [Burkholderia pseudomallei]ARL93820.1 hydrolase [Burkholderia pseudomallei]